MDNRVTALRQHLTYGDLIRPDRAGSTIAMLESALVRRVLMTHRQAGSPYLGTLKAIVRAAHQLEPLDDLADGSFGDIIIRVAPSDHVPHLEDGWSNPLSHAELIR